MIPLKFDKQSQQLEQQQQQQQQPAEQLSELYVLEGQLDYDRNIAGYQGCSDDEDDGVKNGEDNDNNCNVKISIQYPSEKFGTENNQFQKRHESMQADADEHYKLLVDMQVTDPLFDQMLLDNHNRKRKVERILRESRNWQRFIKHVSPSMNY